jgi:hypothetical protein
MLPFVPASSYTRLIFPIDEADCRALQLQKSNLAESVIQIIAFSHTKKDLPRTIPGSSQNTDRTFGTQETTLGSAR